MLNDQEIAFFNVFGFIVLRKVFDSQKMFDMSESFNEIALADRDGSEFKGEKRQDLYLSDRPGFKNIEICDELFRPLSQLLGEDFILTGKCGGGLFVGDTQWHPDIAKVSKQTNIKAGIYLDPVTEETGCLRVVPGSHKNPLHEQLQPLRMGRIKESLKDGSLMSNIAPAGEKGRIELEDWQKYSGIDMDEDNTIFGVDPITIPSAHMESIPGDVVLFNQCIFHASFGGATGRRMVAMSWASFPSEDEHSTGDKVIDLRL